MKKGSKRKFLFFARLDCFVLDRWAPSYFFPKIFGVYWKIWSLAFMVTQRSDCEAQARRTNSFPRNLIQQIDFWRVIVFFLGVPTSMGILLPLKTAQYVPGNKMFFKKGLWSGKVSHLERGFGWGGDESEGNPFSKRAEGERGQPPPLP